MIKCPCCRSDEMTYIEIYTTTTRIVRDADKKRLLFVESTGIKDIDYSAYNCESCRRTFEEKEDGTVITHEKDPNIYD